MNRAGRPALVFPAHCSRPSGEIEVQLKEGKKRMLLMNNNTQAGKNIADICFATSFLSHQDHHFHLLFLMLLLRCCTSLPCSLKINEAFSVFCEENRGEGPCSLFLDKRKPALMTHDTCSLFFILVSMVTCTVQKYFGTFH